MQAELRDFVAPAEAIFLDAKEPSSQNWEPGRGPRDASRFRGRTRPSSTLARVGFDTLGLQTYLTAGRRRRAPGRSTRAGPRRRPPGIHTDTLSGGFIVPRSLSATTTFVESTAASLRPAPTGRVRALGKDYVMADGGVVEFTLD